MYIYVILLIQVNSYLSTDLTVPDDRHFLSYAIPRPRGLHVHVYI